MKLVCYLHQKNQLYYRGQNKYLKSQQMQDTHHYILYLSQDKVIYEGKVYSKKDNDGNICTNFSYDEIMEVIDPSTFIA